MHFWCPKGQAVVLADQVLVRLAWGLRRLFPPYRIWWVPEGLLVCVPVWQPGMGAGDHLGVGICSPNQFWPVLAHSGHWTVAEVEGEDRWGRVWDGEMGHASTYSKSKLQVSASSGANYIFHYLLGT